MEKQLKQNKEAEKESYSIFWTRLWSKCQSNLLLNPARNKCRISHGQSWTVVKLEPLSVPLDHCMRFGVEGTGAAKQRRQELREREEKRILAIVMGGVCVCVCGSEAVSVTGSLLFTCLGAFLNLYQRNGFHHQEVFLLIQYVHVSSRNVPVSSQAMIMVEMRWRRRLNWRTLHSLRPSTRVTCYMSFHVWIGISTESLRGISVTLSIQSIERGMISIRERRVSLFHSPFSRWNLSIPKISKSIMLPICG